MIGLVGAGAMGSAIGARLLAVGHAVTFHDIDPSRGEALSSAGAVRAPSVTDLAHCDHILLCVPTARELTETVSALGPDLAPGTSIISLSTVTPTQAQEVDRLCTEANGVFVDAPVARSTADARDGRLIIMLGAADQGPMAKGSVLWDLAEEIFYCGPVGAGSAMKLVNNLCNQAILFVTEEAFAFGEALELPRELIFTILSTTNANNGHLQRTVATKVFGGDYRPGFPARLSHKDLALAVESAYRAQIPVPVSAGALQATSLCLSTGHGDEDSSVYRLVLEELTSSAAG